MGEWVDWRASRRDTPVGEEHFDFGVAEHVILRQPFGSDVHVPDAGISTQNSESNHSITST